MNSSRESGTPLELSSTFIPKLTFYPNLTRRVILLQSSHFPKAITVCIISTPTPFMNVSTFKSLQFFQNFTKKQSKKTSQ